MITQRFRSLTWGSILLSFVLVLTGCGKGNNDFIPIVEEVEEEELVDIFLNTGAVKGPVAFSEITVYSLDFEGERYAKFNDTSNALFKLYADLGITLNSGQLSLSPGESEATVLNGLKSAFEDASYVTELHYFKNAISAAQTLEQAKTYLDIYLGKVTNSDAVLVEFNLLQPETNTQVKAEVEKEIEGYADLNTLKKSVKKVQGFYGEILTATSFSTIEQIVKDYSAAEQNSAKKAKWSLITTVLEDIEAVSASSKNIIDSYENLAFKDDDGIPLVDIALGDNDQIAVQHLKDLSESLENGLAPYELKQLIYEAQRREGNGKIKDALLDLYYSIVTYKDFVSHVRNDIALYSYLGIRGAISDSTTLQQAYDQSLSIIQEEVTPAFESVLISEELVDDVPENRVTYGVSNPNTLIRFMPLGKYEGLLYIEANSTDSSIDLNTGKKPILSQMKSMIHTDEMRGYRDNQKSDESIYYYRNGIIQRDEDNQFITVEDEIEVGGDDELLTVTPTRFATPITSLAVDMALHKVFSLELYKGLLSQESNYSEIGLSQQLGYFRVDERIFEGLLDSSQRVVSNSFNVTDGSPLSNVFNLSPIILDYMKYEPEALEQVYRYRSNIEYVGALLKDLSDKSEIEYSELLSLLVKDLSDGSFNGKYNEEQIALLSNVEGLEFYGTRSPADTLVPDTNYKITEIASLLENEFSTIVPEQDFDLYQLPVDTVSFISPSGTSNQDGASNLGYDGLRSVSVKFESDQIIPINNSLQISIPITEVNEGLESEKLYCEESDVDCILVGDIAVDINVNTTLVSSPDNHNAQISGEVVTDGTGNRSLEIELDSSRTGDYVFFVELETAAQLNVSKEARLGFEIPVTVFDFNKLEFRLVSRSSDNVYSESLKATEQLVAQFKAVEEICTMFSVCGNENELLGQFLDLSLLGESFRLQYQITKGGSEVSYQTSSALQVGSEINNHISNLESSQIVNASVTYVNKNVSASLAQLNSVVDEPPSSSFRAECPEPGAGIDDVNGDGFIDESDSSPCFKDIIENSSSVTSVTLEDIEEQWYYDDSWRFIIRRNISDNSFIGHIPLSKDVHGEYAKVRQLLVDKDLRRVYLAYSGGDIEYFSVTNESLVAFFSDDDDIDIHAWQLLGSNIVISRLKDEGSASLTNFFDSNGKEIFISFGSGFASSGKQLTPKIGTFALGDYQEVLSLSYQVERYNQGELQSLTGVIANDEVSLDSGQTQFGDTVLLSISIESQTGDPISYTYVDYAIDTPSFSFAETILSETSPPTIEALGLSLQGETVSDKIYVKWYVNGIDDDSLVYKLNDTEFPFVYESSLLEYGDLIRARVYLRRSENYSESDDILLAEIDGAFLGDFGTIQPVLDVNVWNANLDVRFPTVKAVLISGTENDEFFTTEMFKPVWIINGREVVGEDSYEFPTSKDTVVKFGDKIEVQYIITANETTAISDILTLPSLTVEPLATQYAITPTVVSRGDSVSLDMSRFTEQSLLDFEAKWIINGVRDKSERGFTYPSEKLQFGDEIQLELSRIDEDIDDDNEAASFVYKAEKAFVGLNVGKLTLAEDAVSDFLDYDGDGIPNYRDYFRFDGNCSVRSEGAPDDSDYDGIPDLDELAADIRTNPYELDTDGDGVGDLQEQELGSLPNDADSDGDSYTDGFEFLWGSDPTDGMDPVIAQDTDKDGLSDELELVNGTLVNSKDTDGDGLEDGLELQYGTNPLVPDTDGDFLADGVEVRLTLTNPLEKDSEGDGLEDGVEVALSNSSPILSDTDNDGVTDVLDDTVDASLYEVLYLDDLSGYQDSVGMSEVPQGTCYTSFLASNSPKEVVITEESQLDSSSHQEVVFYNETWSELIRFNPRLKTFEKPIHKERIDARIMSVAFSRYNSQLMYIGFSNGSIWSADLAQDNPSLEYIYQLPQGISVDKIVDQGDMLLVSSTQGIGSEVIYLFDHSLQLKEPVDPNGFTTEFDLKQAVWQNNVDSVLWALTDGNTLARLSIEPITASFTFSSFASAKTLGSPIYLSGEEGRTVINTAKGIQFDIEEFRFLEQVSSSFVYGLFHQNQHVTVPNYSNEVNVVYGSSNEWQYSRSMSDQTIMALIPSGSDVLVVSSTNKDTEEAQPYVRIESLAIGDEDANGIPQWWQDIYPQGTFAQFSDRVVPTESTFFSDSLAIVARNDDSDDGDMDEDGIVNSVERALGSCVSVSSDCPNPSDTDNDGLSDLFEIEYSVEDAFSKVHTVSLLSADTDGDGLSDYEEIIEYESFPDERDSDGDLLCDAHEALITGTDPLNNDSDGDGLSDGRELGIFSLDCEALPKGIAFSNPLEFDTDNDGLNDRSEFIATTDPHDPDSDNDGLLDGQEADFGADPLSSNSRNVDSLDGDIDSDGDRLTDSYELNFSNSSPYESDTDGDGLDDYVEVAELGSSPTNKDTDGDGICDVFEGGLGADSSKFPTNLKLYDSDLDGLSDGYELGLELEASEIECSLLPQNEMISDPTIVDSDGDGFSDFEESNYEFSLYDETFLLERPEVNLSIDPMMIDTDGDFLCDSIEKDISNPGEYDSDFDGLSDSEELGLELSEVLCETIVPQIGSTLPLDRDSDKDGITDGDEVRFTLTNPLDVDSDDDGISDGDEDRDGDGLSDSTEFEITGTLFDKADSDEDGIEDPLDDQDNDGVSNEVEIAYGTCVTFNTLTCPDPSDSDQDGLSDFLEIDAANQLGTNPLAEDSDDDGLSDIEEIEEGTDPLLQDSDFDGLTDFEEVTLGTQPLDPDTDKDFLKDGEDDFPFAPDSDGDFIADGIEVHFLNTDPESDDTDGDGLLDGHEVWVYGFIGQDDTILSYGVDGEFILNSRADNGGTISNPPTKPDFETDEDGFASSFAIPTTYDGTTAEAATEYKLFAIREVELTTDVDGNMQLVGPVAENINDGIGSLHIKYTSDPTTPDSDGDGLTDFTELMEIEKYFGLSRFDVNPLNDTNYQQRKSNRTNFKTSDPFNADTDGNGISDAEEDVDGDYYANLQDQNNNNTSVILSDTDSDSLPDGIEILLTKSNPSFADTDGDGLYDANMNDSESIEFEVLYDAENAVREVATTDSCLSQEYRIGSIAGKEYCVELSYISDPTLIDSDGDGTPDRSINDESEIVIDHYPLDNSCHLLSDGVANTEAPFDRQCYSSWMAEQASIDHVQIGGWENNNGISENLIAYTGTGWGRIIRHLLSDAEDSSGFKPHTDISGDSVIEVSSATQRLYFSDPTGLVRYQLHTEDLPNEFVQLPERGTQIVKLLSIGSSLLVISVDSQNPNQRFVAYLYDASGSQIGNAIELPEGIDANTVAINCQNVDCSISVELMFVTEVAAHANKEVQLIEINLNTSDIERSTQSNSFSNIESPISGPIQFSESGKTVYLGSGHQLAYVDLGNYVEGVSTGQPLLLPEGYDYTNGVRSCQNLDCSASDKLLFVTPVAAHNFNEVLFLDINFTNSEIVDSRLSNVFADNTDEVSGPIEVLEGGETIQLESGHQLTFSELDSNAESDRLEKTFEDSSFTSFYNIQETSNHFVALVDDPSPLFEMQIPVSVFVEDQSNQGEGEDSKTKYLLKQMSADESIIQILPHRVNNLDDYLILSVFDSLVDVSPVGVTDQDQDGMPGIFEIFYGLDDSDPNDKFGDSDNDGLTNIEEYILKFDPNSSDSNQDGVSDFQEAHVQ